MFSKIYISFNPEKWSYFKIWLLLFAVTIAIIWLVQLLLLPFVFTSWHAGNGLLIGGDWIGFHNEAVDMAQRINYEGWSAWELWPKGWFPSGIAGALYALTWPEPWVLAPLNAAVHAFSGLLVMKILNIFTKKRIFAIIAAVPFVFFPSAMLWYTQIHRDGYNILGMLLYIYGLLMIAHYSSTKDDSQYSEATGFFTAFSGIVMLWLSRPHTILIFQYAGIILFLFLFVVFIVMSINKTVHWKKALLKIFVFALVLSSITLFTRAPGADKYQKAPSLLDNEQFIKINDSMVSEEQNLRASNAGLNGPLKLAVEDNTAIVIAEEDFLWSKTPFLPSRIDNHFYSIAVMRTVWYPISYGDAASNIDSDVSFHNAIDFIYYLPRALQIAFLAPFPSDWFGEGSYESTTFFRRISGLEMIIIYLLLVPMVYGIWIWRRKIEVYMLFIFCTVMMLPIIYSTPNLGTVYRYRYGYLMLLVALGLAAFCHFLQNRKISSIVPYSEEIT
jgi:hypothetical protein